MTSPQDQYNQLAYYTLAHPNPVFFIHQYIVDAFAAQQADEKTKPITIAFALAGLYLHHEKNYSGRQVQLAHIALAKHKKNLPKFELPVNRGAITAADALAVEPGSKRDDAINNWSASVWQAYSANQGQVADWIKAELGI